MIKNSKKHDVLESAEQRNADASETMRLETFSDGVLAIAITLLILEIKVPSSEALHAAGGFWPALAHLWPSYFGYGVSFLTIGIMWVNHHAMFQYIRRVNRWFLLINVAFLMCVAFLPFPTAVLAEYLPDPTGRVSATVFYGITLFVISIAFNVLWRYGVYNNRLVGHHADTAGIRTISHRYSLGPALYLAATGIAFISVLASLAIHGALALLFALPENNKRNQKEL